LSAHSSCKTHGHHSWSGTWGNVKEDITRQLNWSPESQLLEKTAARQISAFFRPEIQALFIYRLSHFLCIRGWRRTAAVVARINLTLHKVRITPQSCIGPACRLPHPPGVYFHGAAGRELTLFSMAICGASESVIEGPLSMHPTLGNRVSLGATAVVSGPVSVGDDTKIPYTVNLTKDAPARMIVFSKRARLIPKNPAHGSDEEDHL
jgi:serine O-acetyltransferase